MKPGNAGGAKGPQFKDNVRRATKPEGLTTNLPTPSNRSEAADGVARQSEGIAKLPLLHPVRQGVSEDVLGTPIARCQTNGGAAGVDGQTFEDIEKYGVESGWTNWRKN